MLVKKTKKGKFSFALGHNERGYLLNILSDFIEYESALLRAMHPNTAERINRHLFCSIIIDLYIKQQANFLSAEVEQKFSFTRTEALALILLLKECPLEIQELKSSLHQLLS